MTALEQALLTTLCWFDLWRQPLTAFECWYFLWDEKNELSETTPQAVLNALFALEKKVAIKTERGFWQLADSPSYIKDRLARARWSISKRQKATRVANVIRSLPFIRLVALANTLATDGAKRSSDIDLLIIIKSKRLFLGRLLVTTLVQLFGWRRHGAHVADRICLSFYLADDSLNIKELSYADDPYLIYWLASLQPLYFSSTFSELLKVNSWSHKFIPHRFSVLNITTNYAEKFKYSWLEKILAGSIGNMLEYWARRLQLYLINSHKDSRLGDGTSAVVVTDSILKFHESDQRLQLTKDFRIKQQQILAKFNN